MAEGRAAAAQEELEVERGGAKEARRTAAAARPQLQQLRAEAAAAKAAAAAAEEARQEAQGELEALAAALRQTRNTYLACAQVRGAAWNLRPNGNPYGQLHTCWTRLCVYACRCHGARVAQAQPMRRALQRVQA